MPVVVVSPLPPGPWSNVARGLTLTLTLTLTLIGPWSNVARGLMTLVDQQKLNLKGNLQTDSRIIGVKIKGRDVKTKMSGFDASEIAEIMKPAEGPSEDNGAPEE